MNSRLLARSSTNVARQLVTPRVMAAARPVAAVAQRHASSEAFGQEFIKERNHHKEHAGSEFTYLIVSNTEERAELIRIASVRLLLLSLSSESADMWRKVSVYVCVPFGEFLERERERFCR